MSRCGYNGDSTPKDNPKFTKCDLIERAAIIAEGNGWPQDKAERTVAWSLGYGTWVEVLGAAT